MGELTLRVRSIVLLAKSPTTFPVPKEKIQDGKKIIYDEFSDKETRYRKRYLDLVLNQKHFRHFKTALKSSKAFAIIWKSQVIWMWKLRHCNLSTEGRTPSRLKHSIRHSVKTCFLMNF